MNGWKRVGRGRSLRVVGTLEQPEAAVIRGLVSQIREMLAERADEAPADELSALTGIRTGPTSAPADQVMARLLPDFIRPEDALREDTELAGALRSLREPELIQAKQNAAEVILETCPRLGGPVELTEAQADEWVRSLNDVRLALGVALDIADEQDVDLLAERLPEDDPRAAHVPVYHWLTWVQDSLVEALSR